MRNSTVEDRPSFGFSVDPETLVRPKTPNDLWVATYRGAATSRLFIEGQVSRKAWGVRDHGGTSTNIADSPFITFQAGLGHFNAPYFDSNDPLERNNRQVTASATYFLPTERGTHSIKGGFEHFQSTLADSGAQSATGLVFDSGYLEDATGAPVLDANGRFTPVFNGDSGLETYFAVRGLTININTLEGERNLVGN